MNAIFAVNKFGGFGHGNTMPWPRSKQDMMRFRELTTGNTVVMGVNTWKSDMPKPLPNRRNIVLSSTLVDDRCEVATDITDLLMNVGIDEQVFVIGGIQVLWGLRIHIKRVYLTRFFSDQEADKVMDVDKYLDRFVLEHKEVHIDHEFDTYVRR